MMATTSRIPTVLSIAGSDPAGGAGIQADIRTCTALGVYCAAAITSVTVQNPYEFYEQHYVGDAALEMQIRAVLDSMRPDAVKIGLLPTASSFWTVRIILRNLYNGPVVYDPVMSATVGGSLSDSIHPSSFPFCTLITPNLNELKALFESDRMDSKSTFHERDAVRMLLAGDNVEAVLVKGGHRDGETSTDILYQKDGLCHAASDNEKRAGIDICDRGVPGIKATEFTNKRIETSHTHGTGCTLSSAIAAYMAKGMELEEAVRHGISFTHKAIQRAASSPLFDRNSPVIQFALPNLPE